MTISAYIMLFPCRKDRLSRHTPSHMMNTFLYNDNFYIFSVISVPKRPAFLAQSRAPRGSRDYVPRAIEIK